MKLFIIPLILPNNLNFSEKLIYNKNYYAFFSVKVKTKENRKMFTKKKKNKVRCRELVLAT